MLLSVADSAIKGGGLKLIYVSICCRLCKGGGLKLTCIILCRTEKWLNMQLTNSIEEQ
jgi:hypothetical protein